MSNIDFQNLTLEEINEIKRQAEEAAEAKRQETIQKIVELVKENCEATGASMEEVLRGLNAQPLYKDARSDVKVKYQYNQHSWSGRGKTPKWLAELEANGSDREEFRV